MTILEMALLSLAILVGGGSVLFINATRRSSARKNRDAEQKFRDAEQKYRQEREARDSAEDALRRAENEHRESECKLQQAHDELQAAEEIRRQARDEVRAANDARAKAERERDAANERARLAEQARTQAEGARDAAIKERNAALEQARLANERARRSEELQKQAEDARDHAIKERDAAFEQARLSNDHAQRAGELQKQAEGARDAAFEQARLANDHAQRAEELQKQAEDARDTAIKERDAANDRVRLAEQAETLAEKERDAALEQAHLANEQAQRADELQAQAERERDAANERAEQAEENLKELKKASTTTAVESPEPPPIPKSSVKKGETDSTGEPPKQTTSLEGRKGKRSSEPQFHTASTPRSLKPEIICVQKQNAWILKIELPQEFLENYSDLLVLQNKSQLYGEDGCWQLNDACGNLIVRSEKGIVWQTDLGERAGQPLLFKLRGNRERGHCVSAITRGWYLLVVPEDWKHEDFEPEAVSTKGYHAYCRFVDDCREISFQPANGKSIAVTPHVTQFALDGNRLNDADEKVGSLFGNTLPRVRAVNPNAWQQVETIVVGEEGRERKEWKSAEFTPAANKAEQDLPPEIVHWQASWFFVRFYDANDHLIESTDFRLARGVSSIQINQSSLFPTENGHSSTLVEFHHTADCKIEPPSDLEPEYAVGKTTVEIPPSVVFDETCWGITAQNHDHDPIRFTLLVERIWWAAGTKDKTPLDSEWIDKPFSFTRADFAAVSDKVLWLRLPRPRWADETQVGFARETARPFPVKVTEQTVSIPLCDFCDSEYLRQISVSRFSIWVADSNATFVEVRVQAKCRFCDFAADSEEEILSHIESRHLNVIFQPLTYEEHRKRNPALPFCIWICLECDGEDKYVAFKYSSLDKIDIEMDRHVHQKGHARTYFEELTDVKKIRDRLPDLIPDIRRCVLRSCEWEKKNPSKTDLLRHLKENHVNALYELC